MSNQEGISCFIPVKFIGKETHVGDKFLSYQVLRLKQTGLFSMEELYRIALLIESKDPNSLIDWTETFMLLEKDSRPHISRKLRALQLVQ
ncbi:hypothetical protein [Sediminibacterium soli]|uniref:hypothetical protein n=1 Tax=Sediminibacterium soli TaxID=2698829 RepID=UPI00137B6C85|nr:hypothetical protein [Sediminibacterium soli]NCI46823.1 hypothetical protein [Sediminibacterium soli]